MPQQAKRPRDVNQLGAALVAEATGTPAEAPVESDKNPHAQALGRLGGLKGGKARAKKLSSRERSEIARKAARARWSAS